MPPKKSVEELDAELAALEAELAALESGEAAPPKPKKAKKPKKAAQPPEPEAPAPEPEAPAEKRRPLRLPRREAEGEAPRKRFGLPFGGRKAGEPEAAPEAPSEAPPEDAAEPGPAPPPEPEPIRAGATAWEGRAGAWRARPQGPQRVEVVRRELDASGRVVAEESLGEELEAEPAPEPEPEAPRRRFGLFGSGEPEAPAESAAATEGEAPPGRRKRRGWVIIPVLLVAAILLLALVLPALGVDPLGIGSRTGVGGGSPPVAVFAVSANIVAVGSPVVFDAAASRDPAGGALEHNWDFGDGSGAQGAQVTHNYTARGEFPVTLTVRNSAGRTATSTQTITVAAPPTARIAITLGGTPLGGDNTPVADEELAFSATGSTADGGITAYDWQFGDGGRATTAEATHAYSAPGSYRVTLAVVDANGLRGNATQAVYVGLRFAQAGEVPASVQGPQAVNTTVAVTSGGGALPYAPQQLRAAVTWNATGGGGPLPIPLPGLPADSLVVTIYDAAGTPVGTSPGGASPQEVVVTDFSGALGDWSVEVSRSQGGAQPVAYQLEVELRNGPG